MADLRIVFMGTSKLACASLQALTRQRDFSIVGVVTQPDRPKGRDLKLLPSPLKEIALREHLPLLQPARARDESFIHELRQLHPDLITVAAYGQILPPAILDLARLGCLNVHTSLLPKYRGAAPIQWAILNDEAETGVTIMRMDAGLDTGGILTQQATPIRADDNSQTLHDRLAELGADLLITTIRGVLAGSITPRPQGDRGSTYARKLKKEDGLVDWSRPARALWNQVRALTPWPGAFTLLTAKDGRHTLKLWQAEIAEVSGQPGEVLRAGGEGIVVACGNQALRIIQLQREGGRKMAAREFLAGHPVKVGDKLG